MNDTRRERALLDQVEGYAPDSVVVDLAEPGRRRAEKQADERGRALAQADAAMQKAKARFSLASLACLRQAIDAEAQVAAALAEVDAARAALRQAVEA